jgi:hypothetical protein
VQANQQAAQTPAPKAQSSNFIKEAIAKLADTHNADSDYAFSFGNLFRCLCCPREGASPNDVKFTTIMKSIEVCVLNIARHQLKFTLFLRLRVFYKL